MSKPAEQKKKEKAGLLAMAAAALTAGPQQVKARQKKWKRIAALCSVLVVLINMWQDHKEAVIRN